MAYTDNTEGGRIILDTGRGTQPQMVALAEGCEVGDVLGISSSTWVRALGASGAVIQGRVVALKAGVTGESVPVSTNCVVGGLSGAEIGAPVYVAASTLYGETTQTISTTTGDATTEIGMALAADTVMFYLNCNSDSSVE